MCSHGPISDSRAAASPHSGPAADDFDRAREFLVRMRPKTDCERRLEHLVPVEAVTDRAPGVVQALDQADLHQRFRCVLAAELGLEFRVHGAEEMRVEQYARLLRENGVRVEAQCCQRASASSTDIGFGHH